MLSEWSILPRRSIRHSRRHRRILAGLVVMIASALMSSSFAQRTPSAVVGADGFLSLPQKISMDALEGLRATAVDPSAGAAYDIDVQGTMMIVKYANSEIARGFLSENDAAREVCYGFERDDGRLKEVYSLCQPREDLVTTARPRAKDGYFASFKAGALYFRLTLLDRNYGANEAVYSAAMLRPRK